MAENKKPHGSEQRNEGEGNRTAARQYNEAQRGFAQSCEGLTMSVLFEKPGRKAGQAMGRSPYLQPVHVDDAAHLQRRLVWLPQQ